MMPTKILSPHMWIMLAAFAASPAISQPTPPPAAKDGKDCACESGSGTLPFSDEEVLRTILPPLPASAPKPPKDIRNFEGTWVHNQPTVRKAEKGLYAEKVPFTPLARQVRDRRSSGAQGKVAPYSNASAECRAPGQPWLMELYYPFQILQSDNSFTFLYAFTHARWDIPLNRPHSGLKQYLGDSVGRWDGDTLVVDSINYKRGMWLDSNGTPTSSNTRLSHRIRRIEHGEPMLEIVTTVDDPTMYTKPWSFVRTYAWRPDKVMLEEYDCEYQVGENVDTTDTTSYGLQPEPPESEWGREPLVTK